jgi:putative hydrolase of HD superfamily
MKKLHLNLEDMIQFSRLMLQFQQTERAIRPPGRESHENDVEHSYQLAMMAWYLNSSGGLGYDTNLLLRYALVHDLAEAYTGDVHAYDTEGRKGKTEREHRALNLMSHEFPASREFISAIEEYESGLSAEAKFIYALDKLMPMLLVYLEGGRSWREYGLKFEQLHVNKLEKVAVSEPIKSLYDQLAKLLDKNPQLFDTSVSAL